MKLIEMYDKNKGHILDGQYILFDYHLFFDDENIGKYTRFAIDNEDEIRHLKAAIDKLLITDSRASIYVCAYGDESTDHRGERFLYGDSIWVNTAADINEIFDDCEELRPSAIFNLDNTDGDTDEKMQTPILYFTNGGTVMDLSESININKLDGLSVMYWD